MLEGTHVESSFRSAYSHVGESGSYTGNCIIRAGWRLYKLLWLCRKDASNSLAGTDGIEWAKVAGEDFLEEVISR